MKEQWDYNMPLQLANATPDGRLISVPTKNLNIINKEAVALNDTLYSVPTRMIEGLLDKIRIPMSVRKAVEKKYGEDCLVEMANIALKSREAGDNRLLIVIDPHQGQVLDLQMQKNQIIPFESFQYLVNEVATSHQFDIRERRMEVNSLKEVVLLQNSAGRNLFEIARGEEFNGGILLCYHYDQILVMSHVVRMVCLNGSFVKHRELEFSISEISVKSIMDTIKRIHQIKQRCQQEMTRFYHQSKECKSSVLELNKTRQALTLFGIEENEVEYIVNWKQIERDYASVGLSVANPDEMRWMEGDITVWELYNRLTHFGTHAELCKSNPILQNKVLLHAGMIQQKKSFDIKDIKRYPVSR